MILDHAKIRELRVDRGLSIREVSRHLGVTYPVINGIETGRTHDDLNLRTLTKLANLLGVAPATLFRAPPHQDDSVTDTPAPSTDDLTERVGAALAEANQRVRTEHLARTLGLTMAETQTALDALHQRLTGTGVLLQRVGRWNRLIPRVDALNDHERRDLSRLSQSRHGTNLAEAKILYSLLNGADIPTPNTNRAGDKKATVGRLLKRGLVVEHDGHLILGKDFVFGLQAMSN